jgi:hypothetical protein
MARYFFHLRDGSDQLLDPEGRELADLETAKHIALACARDTLSQEIKEGRLDLRYRIDLEDSSSTILHSLPLSEAFEVIRP